jgi:hypothetical protein
MYFVLLKQSIWYMHLSKYCNDSDILQSTLYNPYYILADEEYVMCLLVISLKQPLLPFIVYKIYFKMSFIKLNFGEQCAFYNCEKNFDRP